MPSTAGSRIYLLNKVFDEFDLNSSGSIDTSELLLLGRALDAIQQLRVFGSLRQSREWSETQNAQLLTRIDTDGSGLVSRSDFSSYFEDSLRKSNAQ